MIKNKLKFNTFEILSFILILTSLGSLCYHFTYSFQLFTVLMTISLILFVLSLFSFKSKPIPYVKPTVCNECLNFYHHNCIFVPTPHTHQRVVMVNGLNKSLGYFPCDIINCFGTLPNGKNDIRN